MSRIGDLFVRRRKHDDEGLLLTARCLARHVLEARCLGFHLSSAMVRCGGQVVAVVWPGSRDAEPRTLAQAVLHSHVHVGREPGALSDLAYVEAFHQAFEVLANDFPVPASAIPLGPVRFNGASVAAFLLLNEETADSRLEETPDPSAVTFKVT